MTTPLAGIPCRWITRGGTLQRGFFYIGAGPSRLDSVNLDTFQRIVEKMSAAESLTLTSPPVEFRVKKHPFVRGIGAVHMYRSMVQTVAGDDLLTIEIYAYSTEGLQQMAASLQTMAIPDKEP